MPEQTDTDTIYVLSENAPTQIDNMVGLTEQINLPPGYSRTRLEPTPSQGVWRVERTRRFNVEPLALSQADVTYDKTQASTTTLAAATGGEMPITYSLPLLRGSQDRYDVPGAPVTFDPVTRELNIGSGFDEGLEVNYTARDACDQVANAQVVVRPMGTVDDPDLTAHMTSSTTYSGAGGMGYMHLQQGTLSGDNPLPPFTVEVANNLWADAGWSASVVRDTLNPDRLDFTFVFGSWLFPADADAQFPGTTIRTCLMRITDFLGNTSTFNFNIRFK